MADSEAINTLSVAKAVFSPGKRPLLWLSLVCLDAPVVALVWQLLFGRAFQVPVRLWENLALFLTAWGIYLLDRLADARLIEEGAPVPARIAFCREHRGLLVAVFLFVGLSDGIATMHLSPWLIVHGATLGVVAAIYLMVNQQAHQVWRVLPIKELVVGVLFALGTTLVLFYDTLPGIAVMVFLFALLCSANTLSIAVWEREADLKQGKHSIATEVSGAGTMVRLFCLMLGVISGGLAFAGFQPHLNGAIAASSVLLLVLHCSSIRRDERTALADLVLLTPLVLLLGF